MAIDVRGMAPLLQVYDMPALLRFYCEALGFEVVRTDGKSALNFDWVLLRLHGVDLMLNTAYEAPHRPPKADPKRTAAHQDTGLFFACPDVDAAYRHLRELGIQAKQPKIAPYGMKQFCVTDPDGYELCFQWRADGEK